MANRCLNKVTLIGNLTRDPELRYTPQGVAVCSFGLATNRQWTTQGGEQKEDAQFHRIVAWNKLAELCSQLLVKGRRVFVEGRLQYREWTTSEGSKRRDSEIIIRDMIILDSRQTITQESSLESELESTTMYSDNNGGEGTVSPGTAADESSDVPAEKPVKEEKAKKSKDKEERPF